MNFLQEDLKNEEEPGNKSEGIWCTKLEKVGTKMGWRDPSFMRNNPDLCFSFKGVLGSQII